MMYASQFCYITSTMCLLLTLLISFAWAETEKKKSLVLELTKHNFDEIVMDRNKNVLVEFYAPWCGNCKLLEPVLEKVAKTFQDEGDIVLAKLDAEYESKIANRFKIIQMPTILFFSRGSNEKMGENYDSDDRTEQGFVNYLNGKCGKNRLLGGEVNELAGRIDAFDSMAERFMTDEDYREDAIASISATAEQEIELRYKNSGEYYVRVMKKVLEKGEGYVTGEIARLEKLLTQSVPSERKTMMLKRKNILNVFRNAGVNVYDEL